MLIGIADKHLRPIVEAWQSMFGDEKVLFEVFPSAEAAEAFLENNAISVLLTRHDMKDVEKILSLLEYLKAEKDSTAHAQIIEIRVVAPTWEAAQRLMHRLEAIKLFRVAYQPLLHDLFTCEPAGSIRKWATPEQAVPGTDYHHGPNTDLWIEPGTGPGYDSKPRDITVDPPTSSCGYFVINGDGAGIYNDWPSHQNSNPH